MFVSTRADRRRSGNICLSGRLAGLRARTPSRFQGAVMRMINYQLALKVPNVLSAMSCAKWYMMMTMAIASSAR